MHSTSRQLIPLAFCVVCMQAALATMIKTRSTASTSKNFVHRQTAMCRWPALPYLQGSGGRLETDSLIEDAGPEAFETWRDCAAPLRPREAERKLRKLRRSFMGSEWGEELVTLSGCKRSEILALFDLNASEAQARNAVNCVRHALRMPNEGIRGVVRIDEDCERMKRNMIRRAENLLAAALVAVAGTGVCCAIPLSAAGWCPLFAAALIAEVTAIAELQSARNFECPRCSGDPVARVGFTGSRQEYKKRFLVPAVPKALSRKYAPTL